MKYVFLMSELAQRPFEKQDHSQCVGCLGNGPWRMSTWNDPDNWEWYDVNGKTWLLPQIQHHKISPRRSKLTFILWTHYASPDGFQKKSFRSTSVACLWPTRSCRIAILCRQRAASYILQSGKIREMKETSKMSELRSCYIWICTQDFGKRQLGEYCDHEGVIIQEFYRTYYMITPVKKWQPCVGWSYRYSPSGGAFFLMDDVIPFNRKNKTAS